MNTTIRVAILCSLAIIGCSSRSRSGGVPHCTPGTTQFCACLGSDDGVQTCNTQGTFDDCECGMPGDGDPSPSMNADAGLRSGVISNGGNSSGGSSNGGSSNGGSSSGGSSNGGSSSGDPTCDQVQEETGCYEPIVIQKGSLTQPGVPCEQGLSECGEECPGQNMWCCPTGYSCEVDDLVVRALCQDESESINIMCIPPDVKRCNYTPQEALDHLSRHDLGCIQHLGDGAYYNCDIHGPQSQTKCVAAWDPNGLGNPVPLCPDQAASCVPTGP